MIPSPSCRRSSGRCSSFARLRAKLEALRAAAERADRDHRHRLPVPGSVSDPDAFWELLRDGVDAIREVPADRWDVDAYYDPDSGRARQDGDALGRVSSTASTASTPTFFGISPREAVSDGSAAAAAARGRLGGARARRPWRPTGWRERRPACSSASCDERLRAARSVHGRRRDDRRLLGTGSAHSVVAGRRLVRPRSARAEHSPSTRRARRRSSRCTWPARACARGECALALAGGVNVDPAPGARPSRSRRARMLAADGRCKTFDAAPTATCAARAAASSCSSGCRTRSPTATACSRVIRGSAVNQDGRSSGLTAPNGPAQEAVDARGARRWRGRPRPASTTSRRTAPARRSAIRSRCSALGRCARRRARGGAAAARSARSRPTSATRGGGRRRRSHQGGARAAARASSRRACTSACRTRISAAARPPIEVVARRQPWPRAPRRGAPASARSASAARTPTSSSRRRPQRWWSRRRRHLLRMFWRSRRKTPEALRELADRFAAASGAGRRRAIQTSASPRTRAERTSITAWRSSGALPPTPASC